MYEEVSYAETVKFIPPIIGGMVIKVYDGDTITIANKLPYDTSPMYRFSVRLNGIDCPEMRTTNETEKQCAIIAKEFLLKTIMNKYVSLQNIDVDKYGRILADVLIDGENVSDMLLIERLAVRYDGGTKIVPDDWMKYHNGC
jgi:endonuclease YncB( thermonuclease family)